jgi:hypothetical protein
MFITDPVKGKIQLSLEKEHDAEYYRLPLPTLENIKNMFGLSKVPVNDIHITCVKNSFHVTMEIREYSYHIGVRPNASGSEIEFWPIAESSDYLKTYRENIFNTLYYIYNSILDNNQSMSLVCGNINLTQLRSNF